MRTVEGGKRKQRETLFHHCVAVHIALVAFTGLEVATCREGRGKQPFFFHPFLSSKQHGHVGVLKALVQHGVDVNVVDSTGYTALHMAGKQLE